MRGRVGYAWGCFVWVAVPVDAVFIPRRLCLLISEVMWVFLSSFSDNTEFFREICDLLPCPASCQMSSSEHVHVSTGCGCPSLRGPRWRTLPPCTWKDLFFVPSAMLPQLCSCHSDTLHSELQRASTWCQTLWSLSTALPHEAAGTHREAGRQLHLLSAPAIVGGFGERGVRGLGLGLSAEGHTWEQEGGRANSDPAFVLLGQRVPRRPSQPLLEGLACGDPWEAGSGVSSQDAPGFEGSSCASESRCHCLPRMAHPSPGTGTPFGRWCGRFPSLHELARKTVKRLSQPVLSKNTHPCF